MMLKSNPAMFSSSRAFSWFAIAIALSTFVPATATAQDLKLKLQMELTPKPVKPGMLLFEGDLSSRAKVGIDSQPKMGHDLPAQKKASPDELLKLQADLADQQFQVRKAASERLKTLTTEDMGKLAKAILNSPSAEALIRVHSELDMRYQAKSPAERVQASRLLESMAGKARLLSADPATHSLQKHWQTRIDVAFAELKDFGAIIKYGNFSRPTQFRARSTNLPARQILLTKSWTGGDAGLEVFRRLKFLAGPLTMDQTGVQVFLLSGHTLSPEQEAKLVDIVGANRIQYRSLVALGITASRMNQGLFEGVLIQGVSKGGSAEKAGLAPGDFLLAMYGPGEKVRPMEYDPEAWRTFRQFGPEPADGEEATKDPYRLLDFDHLVDRLKKFEPGDKVKIQVVKQFRSTQMFRPFPGVPVPNQKEGDDLEKDEAEKVIEVEVELIGWADLPMVNS